MKKKFTLVVALVLALTLALGVVAGPVAAATSFNDWGPQVDEIIMPIITENTAQRIAFERGESVVWAGLTQAADIDHAKSLKDIADKDDPGPHVLPLL